MSYEEEIAWGVQQMLDADLQFPQEVHYSKKPVRTNADHIRSMSDDELTYLLHDYYCEGHADGLYHIYDAMHISDVRKWLKQPYGGDT